MLSIIDSDIEFSLKNVMNHDAGLDTDLIILRVPVSLVGDWNTVPSVWVRVSESLADAPNDSLSKDMWLLVKMMMVGIEFDDLPIERWKVLIVMPIGYLMIAFRFGQVLWALLSGKAQSLRLADEAADALKMKSEGAAQ